MVCVYCGQKTQVVNSRPQRKTNQVWRRRCCTDCGSVFSTQESVQYELAWLVWDGKRAQPFLRDKLLLSLYKSCEHRKTALSDAIGLSDTVIQRLHTYAADGRIASRDIVQVAQVALNRFDKTASVYYAAYHRLT